MDLFDLVIAKKLAGGGGGGGSSDFSTATVTVNGVGPFIAEAANIMEDATRGLVFKSPLETSFIVILYKGVAILEVTETEFEIPPSETNIYYDADNGYYIITGDCTITIS